MNKIIISLTSYPARIHIVARVIKSLFEQTEQADEIVLWLSIIEFPNKNKDLPDRLNELVGKNGFRIEWVNENIKSHKKYFYVLQNSKDIVITVDDDMIYSNQMVSTLMDSYRRHPSAISARNIHVITKMNGEIAPYVSWMGKVNEYIDQERMDLCAIGASGILYPPECCSSDWFDLNRIEKYAENQDDLWLKFNEIISNIPIVYTGMRGEDTVIEEALSEALYYKNMLEGVNDDCINRLTGVLEKSHEKTYRRWFDGLMSIDEFRDARRDFFRAQLMEFIGRRNGKAVYICGAGKYAHILYDFIVSCELQMYITAFLVTDNGENRYKDKKELKRIGDLDESEAFIVLCGVSEYYREEMKEALANYRLHEWVELDLTGIEMLLEWERKFLR